VYKSFSFFLGVLDRCLCGMAIDVNPSDAVKEGEVSADAAENQFREDAGMFPVVVVEDVGCFSVVGRPCWVVADGEGGISDEVSEGIVENPVLVGGEFEGEAGSDVLAEEEVVGDEVIRTGIEIDAGGAVGDVVAADGVHVCFFEGDAR